MTTKDTLSVEEKGNSLRNDFFIKKTAGKFIINSVIAVLFVYASSFIDTIIVGIFLGEKGLSAMSLVSPVYLIFYTVGATIGIGGSILASRALGAGDYLQYKKIFTVSTFSLLIAAAIMMIASYVFFDGISDILCANVTIEQKELFKGYFKFYIPGGAATLMSYVPLYFLKTDGRPKISSRLFTLSGIINIILTSLFMSPIVNMGISGASFATSIAMTTVAVLGFVIIPRGKTELKIVKKAFSFKLLKNIAKAGLPNGITNLLTSARIMYINYLLLLSGTSLLSCYTIVRNVSDILNSVIVGISSAIIPLVGVFFGERDFQSNRNVMKYALKLGLIIMAILVVIISLAPGLVFSAFSVTNPDTINEGRWAIPLACVGLIVAYVNTLNIGYLTAIKRETFATVLVVLRLFGVLALLSYPLSLAWGSKGIWLSFSLSEVFTYIIYLIILGIIRKKNNNLDNYLVDSRKNVDGDVTFSVKNDVNDIVNATEQVGAFCENNDIDMKKSMKISLAIEEILTFLNSHMLDNKPDNYTDVRVCKMENEVMIRFRYIGKVFDPITFYEDNASNEEMQDELIGLKMIFKSASFSNHTLILGANNLVVVF